MPKQTFHFPFTHAYKRFSPIIKSKKTVSYFTITLTLLSLSFFGLAAIRPTLITAVSLLKSVSDLKKLNIEYENKIGSIVRAQSEYEQIRDNLPLIETALPRTGSFHTLATSLENFAQNSNVSLNQLQIDSVSISKLPPSGQLNKFGFSLIAVGDYSSISSFLQTMLNSQRIVTIDTLDFASEGGTTSGTIRITLKANTYYEP